MRQEGAEPHAGQVVVAREEISRLRPFWPKFH